LRRSDFQDTEHVGLADAKVAWRVRNSPKDVAVLLASQRGRLSLCLV
jgi:hypothetical protein